MNFKFSISCSDFGRANGHYMDPSEDIGCFRSLPNHLSQIILFTNISTLNTEESFGHEITE